MSIKLEVSSDLALRNYSKIKEEGRLPEECIPENIKEGEIYGFLKRGQRDFWMDGEVALVETKGGEILSEPKASIIFLEITHFRKGNETWTKGKYKVVKAIKNNEVYFSGCMPVSAEMNEKAKRPKVGLAVLIKRNGKYLLGKRKNTHGEGTWASVGGHLEFFESLEDCAKREAKEEIGRELYNIKYLTATNDFFKEDNKHYITIFMTAEIKDNEEPKLMEPEKCEEWRWFSLEEFPDNLIVTHKNLFEQGFLKKIELKAKKKVGAGFGVILIKDNKILLGMRHPDPDKADSAFRSAGEWSLPGGKLDFGESLEDGAVREVKEETSIIIKNPKVISMHNCKNEHAHFLTAGLLATEWEGEAKVMEADEMIKWEWFDINELPYPRYFPSFEVIENYMQDKFYIKRQ